MAKPIKTLELHYQMIQFLIIIIITKKKRPFKTFGCRKLLKKGLKTYDVLTLSETIIK